MSTRLSFYGRRQNYVDRSFRPKVVTDVLVTFDAATIGGGLTFSHTCTGSNRYLTVEVQLVGTSVTVSGITYNGVAMTLIQRATNVNAVELWGLVNPASGSNSVAITLSGATGSAQGAASYTNVDQTNPLGSAGSATGSAGTANGPSLTTVNGDMIVDALVAA